MFRFYKKVIATATTIALSISMAMMLLTGSAFASDVKLGMVRGENVNIREKASQDAEVVATLQTDDAVAVLGSEGSFYQVSYDGTKGYISDQFLSVSSGCEGTINAKNVILRKEASTKSGKVATLSRSTKVIVYHEREEFFRIACDDGIGYVFKEYIDLGDGTSSVAESKSSTSASSVDEGAITGAASSDGYQAKPGSFTDDELELITLLIYNEQRGVTINAYHAMASVVYNRLQSKSFPSTVDGVVFQKGQFSVTRNLDKFYSYTPNDVAKQAVRDVFVDGKVTLPAEVMYFKSDSLPKAWGSSRTFYATIEGQHYYS